MAVREIKTRLAMDGEREFSRAIAEAERSLRTMGSELKVAASEFELTGDKQKQLATTSRTLGNQIKQQEAIMKAYADAVEESAAKYGDADKRTDGYRIKLNNATASLNRMRKQLEETDRELEELGRDSTRVGRQIEDGIGDSAQEASRHLDDLIESMQQDLGEIRGSTTFSAISDGWGMVTGAYQAAAGFAESTRDLRRQMAFLEQNATDAGFDFTFVKGQLNEVASITGEVDGAVEGISNILATGFDTHQFELAVDAMAGAVIRFPDTLKFESLADGLQETLASGSATGAFSELLSRMGYDVEEFNKALEASPTKAGDLEIALAYLTAPEGGLIKSKEAFEANYSGLVNAEASTRRWEQALSDLGGTIDEKITPARDVMSGALEDFNKLINSDWDALGEKYGMDREDLRQETIRKTGQGRETGLHFDEWGEAWGNIASGIGSAPADLWDKIGTGWNNLFGGAEEAGKAAGEQAMDSAIEGMQSKEADLQYQINQIDQQLANAWNLGDAESIDKLTKSREVLQNQLYEMQLGAELGGAEAGATAIDAVDKAVQEGAGTVESNANIIGGNVATEVGNGIIDKMNAAVSGAAALADGVLAELGRINQFEITPALNSLGTGVYSTPAPNNGAGSGAGSAGAGGGVKTREVSINLNVSGRRLATVMADDIDAALA